MHEIEVLVAVYLDALKNGLEVRHLVPISGRNVRNATAQLRKEISGYCFQGTS